MLNLIRLEYFHWLNVGFAIRDRYEMLNERVIFIVGEGLAAQLKALQLIYKEDYILEKDVGDYSCYQKINLVVHHYLDSINKIPFYAKALRNSSNCLNISFYADGYTNQFLSMSARNDVLSETPGVSLRHLISFDLELFDCLKDSSYYSNSLVVKSENFINGLAVYDNQLKDFKFNLIKSLPNDCEKITILAIRPWGSNLFCNRDYGYPVSELSLVNSFVGLLDMSIRNAGSVVLFKGDNREPIYSENLYNIFSAKTDLRFDLINLDCCIQPELNFDPYLHAIFSIGKSVEIYSMDSTLPLPFLNIKYPVKFFIGYPDHLLDELGFDDVQKYNFSCNVLRMKKFIKASAPHISINDIEAGFFTV